jgi:bisphosphoglycerate-independent phosphoglycerate mutase (AlkP superfamily)
MCPKRQSNLDIQNGGLECSTVLGEVFAQARSAGKAVHFLGLLSDGGVHSHEAHLHALLRLAAKQGNKDIYVHPIMGGRDVSPESSLTFLNKLAEVFAEIGVGSISTMCGCYFMMDRAESWDRRRAYIMLTQGKGAPLNKFFLSASGKISAVFPTVREAILACRECELTDESFLLCASGKGRRMARG